MTDMQELQGAGGGATGGRSGCPARVARPTTGRTTPRPHPSPTARSRVDLGHRSLRGPQIRLDLICPDAGRPVRHRE